ncbi:MAG TPA: nitroreductase [Pseudomonadales bacterium]|nr:nitroreductase [Pseudomonadales bacterium]
MSTESILSILHNRVSVGDLTDPAPTPAQREAIYRAALRAPDHGQLRPWRFLWVEGEQRQVLADIFVAVEEQLSGPLTDAQRSKIASRPLRAPLVLLVIARVQQHAKVPELEQLLSTAAAVQNMLVAAHAMGVGAMWRTGLVTYEPLLAQKLGLAADERLLGFLYLGTPRGVLKAVPDLQVEDHFAMWRPPTN